MSGNVVGIDTAIPMRPCRKRMVAGYARLVTYRLEGVE
jgi:hypothetical protein